MGAEGRVAYLSDSSNAKGHAWRDAFTSRVLFPGILSNSRLEVMGARWEGTPNRAQLEETRQPVHSSIDCGSQTLFTSAEYFDVSVANITNGVARVCYNGPEVKATTSMGHFYCGAWVAASDAVTAAEVSVCGTIPVAALTGTPPPIGGSSTSVVNCEEHVRLPIQIHRSNLLDAQRAVHID